MFHPAVSVAVLLFFHAALTLLFFNWTQTQECAAEITSLFVSEVFVSSVIQVVVWKNRMKRIRLCAKCLLALASAQRTKSQVNKCKVCFLNETSCLCVSLLIPASVQRSSGRHVVFAEVLFSLT